jgi:hypothetical protein
MNQKPQKIYELWMQVPLPPILLGRASPCSAKALSPPHLSRSLCSQPFTLLTQLKVTEWIISQHAVKPYKVWSEISAYFAITVTFLLEKDRYEISSCKEEHNILIPTTGFKFTGSLVLSHK